MQHMIYHWKHGWIPLTHAAALSKAHGSAKGAEKYVHGAALHHESQKVRGLSARTIHEGLHPHSVFAGHDLTKLSDDTLYQLMGKNLQEHDINHVVAELDRRDRVTRQKRRLAEKRQARDAARDAEYERRLSAGDDPETAYEDVYGKNVARQRRDQAISSLRENGYKGAGFDALTRAAFKDHLEQSFFHAETFTKGHWFKGKTNVNERRNPRTLFNGSEAYARANASEELLAYWQQHGRLTLEDFRASLLGGQLKAKGRAAWY